MTLDLAVLALLAVAALLGAVSGALRQVVSLAAVGIGILAARTFGPHVAEGLSRTLSHAARLVAPVILFAGAFALCSLVGAAILRGTGVARVVRGPADRACGAILGGAKGALTAWTLLSAVALAGDLAPRVIATRARGSDFAALAREHNLIARIDPNATRALERALDAAKRARAAGRLGRDPDSARLLERVGVLEGPAGAPLDPARAARVLEDPELKALVERLAGRAPPSLAQ